MPTIEFNNFWMQGFGQRVIRVSEGDVGNPNRSICGFLTYSTGSSTRGRLTIMKGTIPTDFSTLTQFGDRSTDILINFLQTNSSSAFLTPVSTNPLVISSTGVTASASGLATWFWMMSYDNGATSTSPIYQQAFGTVGLRGSGADLEISDTNIVSGQTYRINSLKINFPSVYTY